METLHLKIKNKETYEHLLWFLGKFDPNELQVLSGKERFHVIQEELTQELKRIDAGESTFMDIEVFDKELDQLIQDYEN